MTKKEVKRKDALIRKYANAALRAAKHIKKAKEILDLELNNTILSNEKKNEMLKKVIILATMYSHYMGEYRNNTSRANSIANWRKKENKWMQERTGTNK